MKTKIQKINIQTAALLTAALLGIVSPALAQNVSISPTGNAPDNSAALDIRDYTDKGILIPRIALTSNTDVTTIPSPATSLLVYNNGTGGLTPAGYYYNAGTPASPNWVRLLPAIGTGGAWLTTGNAGLSASSNFLGTTDNVPLIFRTNNVERMRILSTNGNVGVGTATPAHRLDVNGRGIADYGWQVRMKDTTLNNTTTDLGTTINGLLQVYDYVRILLPSNTTWTWNVPVLIQGGKQVYIVGVGYTNGANNITVQINMTSNGTYTDPLCNGGNPTKNVPRAIISRGLLSIEGVRIEANVCDSRPVGCWNYHRGLFQLSGYTAPTYYLGNSNQVLAITQSRIFSNEDVVSIGTWARADVIFGHTFFDIQNNACANSIYAVVYYVGWNFSGGTARISSSHTTLGPGVSFHTHPNLQYFN